jgi:hypothetical protein
MSWLTGELHADGWTASRYPGFGILAEYVPDDGEEGPSILYNDALANPGSELRFEIVTQPAYGSLEWDELGRIVYIGDGTADSFTYALYVDGVYDDDYTVTLAEYVNVQAVVSGLTGTAIASAVMQSSFTNKQLVSSSGALAAEAFAAFNSFYVNNVEDESVQNIRSGLTVIAQASAVFNSSVTERQNILSVFSAVAFAYAEFYEKLDTSTPYTDVTSSWLNVYQQVGITPGRALIVQNVGNAPVLLCAAAAPPINNTGLMVMPGQQIELASGVPGLYAKSLVSKGAAITARDKASYAVLRPLLIDYNLQPNAEGLEPEIHWSEATGDWQSVQSLTGLPKAVPLVLQNISNFNVQLAARNIQPLSFFDIIASPGQLIEFNGSDQLWIKTSGEKAIFTVQLKSHFQLLRPVSGITYSSIAH